MKFSLVGSLFVCVLVSTVARGTTISVLGAGGDIPDAAPDGTVTPFVSDISASDIQVSDTALIPLTGANVFVELIGLAHPASGDLIATLTYDPAGVNLSADLFNRIGMSVSEPFGAAAQFQGDYNFDSTSSNDIWAAAAGLGTADAIPNGTYIPVTINDIPSNMSSIYNGQPAKATWELTISDNANGPPNTNVDFIQSIVNWQLTFNAVDVPEPSYFAPLAIWGCVFGVFLRKKPSAAGRTS